MSSLVAIEQQACEGARSAWVIEDGRAVRGREDDRRLSAVRRGLMRHPNVVAETADADDDTVERTLHRLHDRAYIEALDAIRSQDPIVMPQLAAPGLDPDIPICTGLVRAAREGVRTSISAAQRVARGARFSYALSRPPGHHAGPCWCGGYCYLNTAVAAAVTLQEHGAHTVGILDLDLHYPNGTAAIVERLDGIRLYSLHSPPTNVPSGARVGSADSSREQIVFERAPSASDYLESIATLMAAAARFGDALVLSIGYDTVRNDPHGYWRFSPAIFRMIGRLLAGSGLPVCMVQEGGYSLARLAACSHALAAGLLGEPVVWQVDARTRAGGAGAASRELERSR
jgi:acetoin utilization deacetylase AcuC-like enzyme